MDPHALSSMLMDSHGLLFIEGDRSISLVNKGISLPPLQCAFNAHWGGGKLMPLSINDIGEPPLIRNSNPLESVSMHEDP